MTKLHFQPIQGKATQIIDAFLHTEEILSLTSERNIIRLVVEELIVNIVNYSGSDYIDIELVRDKDSITLCFRDNGIPFNPLERVMPDTTLPLEKRQIGGLGIYLVIKKTDAISYEYTNGENILTVSKKIKS
jgi:anti-sigma regulatory factor (Ser/Thr protein kinase)